MNYSIYAPEMKEKRPVDTEIDATRSHYSNHYYLKTRLTLPEGRGIKRQTTSGDKPGVNCYRVTIKVLEKLCQQYKVSSEYLLD